MEPKKALETPNLSKQDRAVRLQVTSRATRILSDSKKSTLILQLSMTYKCHAPLILAACYDPDFSDPRNTDQNERSIEELLKKIYYNLLKWQSTNHIPFSRVY